MGKYSRNVSGNKIEFDTSFERKVYDGCEWQNYFKGESDANGTAIEYQKAGTNTTNVTIPEYQVNGTAIQAVAKGCLPTPEVFWSTNTPGTYTLTRERSSLVVGETTFGNTQFRGKATPKEVLIVVVGGGGGGGGNGNMKESKNSYWEVVGGAGGGGGVAVIRVDLTACENGVRLTVGSGGSKGTHGATGENISSGTAGGNGEASTVYRIASLAETSGNVLLAQANGGAGGTGGVGGDKTLTAGTGGNGGTANAVINAGPVLGGQAIAGGKGNHQGDHNRTSCKALQFTPTLGTGAPQCTFVEAKNNDGSSDAYAKNYDSSRSYDSYFSGGCSLGFGMYPYKDGDNVLATGGPGGGGMGGGIYTTNAGDGCNGYIAVCY